jgi:hypothetical protein
MHARNLASRLLAASIASACISVAAADIRWFDGPGPVRPLGMAELVAWSDAALGFDGQSLVALADEHCTYTDAWALLQSSVAGSGEPAAHSESPALRRLMRALRERAGATPLGVEVISLIEGLERIRPCYETEAFARVRARLLALTSELRRDGDVDRARSTLNLVHEALQSVGRTAWGDPLAVAVALRPLRARLAASVGAEQADELCQMLAEPVEFERRPTLGPRMRRLIECADRLTEAERAAAIAALDGARAARRAALLDPPPHDGAAPRGEQWRLLEAGFERTMIEALARAIGGPRAQSAELLVHGAVAGDGQEGDDPNAHADRLMDQFMTAPAAERLAKEFGEAFWRNTFELGSVFDEDDGTKLRGAWSLPLLASAMREPVSADETAVLETVLADHCARVAGMQSEADLRDLRRYTDAMRSEDDRVLAELRAAFRAERLSEESIAVIQLARVEAGDGIGDAGRMLAGRGAVGLEAPSASLAMLALGVPQRMVPPLAQASRAMLYAVLAERAPAMRGEWLDDRRAFLARADELAESRRALRSQMLALAGTTRGNEVKNEETAAQIRALQSQVQATEEEMIAARASLIRRAHERSRSVVEALLAKDVERTDHAALAAAQACVVATIQPLHAASDAATRFRSALDRVDDQALRDRVVLALLASVGDPGLRLTQEIDFCTHALSAVRRAERGQREDLDALPQRAFALGLQSFLRTQSGLAMAWLALRDAGVEDAREAFAP